VGPVFDVLKGVDAQVAQPPLRQRQRSGGSSSTGSGSGSGHEHFPECTGVDEAQLQPVVEAQHHVGVATTQEPDWPDWPDRPVGTSRSCPLIPR